MKIKKKIYLIMLLIIAIFMGIPFVYGTSKSNDNLQNHLAIPLLKGDIKETFTPDVSIKIGDKAQVKKVSVENKGNTPFFVRVMIFPEIMTKSDDLLASNIGKEVIVDLNNEWLDGKDGYYYYNGKVLPEKATSNIFETVKIAKDVDEKYQGANFSIQIKIETINSSNLDYRKAWWNGDVNVKPINNEWKTIDDSLELLVQSHKNEGE